MSFFKRQDLTKMQAQLAALKGGNSFSKDDPTEWKLTTDKTTGIGEALIRFLPGKGDDKMPVVQLVNHGFKVNGKWFIENCPSTHGDFDGCPVCAYIKEHNLYETDKSKYQDMKRKTSYWANILVIKDPAKPENNGKVFKYRFGKKIYDKIMAMSNVNTDMGEIPVNVFCPFDGANFLLKAKKVDRNQNYDDSRFMTPSAVPGIEDEATAKQIWDGMHDLDEICGKDKFKSREDLEKQFSKVMGVAAVAGAAATASAALAGQLDSFDAQMEAFNSAASSPVTSQPAATLGSADDLLAGMMDSNSSSDMDDLDSLLAM